MRYDPGECLSLRTAILHLGFDMQELPYWSSSLQSFAAPGAS